MFETLKNVFRVKEMRLIFNRFTVSDFEEHNKNNYQIS